jgi:hypothetical protein
MNCAANSFRMGANVKSLAWIVETGDLPKSYFAPGWNGFFAGVFSETGGTKWIATKR